jgi:hypothetical protein
LRCIAFRHSIAFTQHHHATSIVVVWINYLSLEMQERFQVVWDYFRFKRISPPPLPMDPLIILNQIWPFIFLVVQPWHLFLSVESPGYIYISTDCASRCV